MERKKVKDYIQTPEGYKQFRDKVDEILINFDFEKVQKVMKALDWKWAFWEDIEGEQHTAEVPDIHALQCQAQKLLIDAVEKGYGGTGGFEVSCYVYDPCDEDGVPYTPDEPDDFEHSVCLSLTFVVEEYGRTY